MDIEREGIPVLKDTPHHYEGPSLSKLQTFRLNWRVGSQNIYWYLITSWRNLPENSLLTLSVLPYKFQVNFISVFQSNLDIYSRIYIYIFKLKEWKLYQTIIQMVFCLPLLLGKSCETLYFRSITFIVIDLKLFTPEGY